MQDSGLKLSKYNGRDIHNYKITKLKKMKKGNYKKLAISLIISFVIMYSVMFLNVNDTGHIYLSLNRMYMTLLMVSPMALIMLFVMGSMYKNKKLNSIIGLAAVVVFVLSFISLRNQAFVGDIQYMKVMIPHHSSAIMTSKNADIEDPEVKKLSEGIIQSQEKEIAEMKAILKRMGN
jgi:hypothetical protein